MVAGHLGTRHVLEELRSTTIDGDTIDSYHRRLAPAAVSREQICMHRSGMYWRTVLG
ncbi:hypothetical protein J6590_021605 [Homalodisca vitripennis]|nr:hypothetical protein J6590_021605 [Homalodisca vitripennis]